MTTPKRSEEESLIQFRPGKKRSASASVTLALAVLIGVSTASAQTIVITTVAGNGVAAYSGDGQQAVFAALNHPAGIAVDASGNIYFADQQNHRIRRITAVTPLFSGTISTVAGTGTPGFSGDGGLAVNAQLNQPSGVFVDVFGNLYIADSGNQRIRKVTPAGTISTIAGTGAFGFNGDNIPAVNALLNRPIAVVTDSSGNLYIADSSNQRIRKVATNGIITTVAGNGVPAYSGEGVAAISASLTFPAGVALDSAGNLFIADAGNQVVRKVTASGIITTVAGNGQGAGSDRGSFSGDGGAATSAGLNFPEGIAVDAAGNFYIADSGNYRIRRVSGGVISTISGTGADGFSGDGSLAILATMNLPSSVTLDTGGNLLVSDVLNNRIRKITAGAATTGTPPTTPTINAGGVLNNASYNLSSLSVAPGSIVAIFGSNLTDGTSCLAPACNPSFGSNSRLNTTMTGAQVTVNGIPVPIFYSLPNQLGVEIPSELNSTSATVQVTVSGRTSSSVTISMSSASPGIFTFTADGKGAGAITHADLLGTPITSRAPASSGEMVIIYATGLGQVTPFVATGALATGTSTTVAPVTVTIDGISVIPDFAGLAGCCIGLNQINVRIPANVHSGAAIPVFLSISGKLSNTVTIAVQ